MSTHTAAAPRITTTGLVEIHNVHKSYAGVEVLSGIDLTIAPGEVVAILGPSGWESRRCCARSTTSSPSIADRSRSTGS